MNKWGSENTALPSYPLPSSKSQVYQEKWLDRTGTNVLPSGLRANTMPTHSDRSRPDPAVFMPEDHKYYGARPTYDVDVARTNLAELKRQEIAGVAVAPSDNNRHQGRQQLLDHSLLDRMRESTANTINDTIKADVNAHMKQSIERAQANYDQKHHSGGNPAAFMPLPHTQPAMPLMYDREDPSTAELLALQGQLKGLQGLNKAVMEPYSYGQFGNPYMVPPQVPPFAYAEAAAAESTLLHEAAGLRTVGHPTSAAILERRAAEIGYPGMLGAKFPDVPHSVEQEQEQVLNSRKMMQAQGYADMYSMENSRVQGSFQPGWGPRGVDVEIAARRAREEFQARNQFEARQIELKRQEAEAAAHARMQAESEYKLHAIHGSEDKELHRTLMDIRQQHQLGLLASQPPGTVQVEGISGMAVSAKDSRLVRELA